MTPNQREDMDRDLEAEKRFRPLNRVEPKPDMALIGFWIVAGILGASLLIFALDFAFGCFR